MSVAKLCIGIALLSDLIKFLEGNDVGVCSAFGTGWTDSFGCLPKAYRDAFAACLADEEKLLRVHRAATPECLHQELLLWIDELTHIISSPNAQHHAERPMGAIA